MGASANKKRRWWQYIKPIKVSMSPKLTNMLLIFNAACTEFNNRYSAAQAPESSNGGYHIPMAACLHEAMKAIGKSVGTIGKPGYPASDGDQLAAKIMQALFPLLEELANQWLDIGSTSADDRSKCLSLCYERILLQLKQNIKASRKQLRVETMEAACNLLLSKKDTVYEWMRGWKAVKKQDLHPAESWVRRDRWKSEAPRTELLYEESKENEEHRKPKEHDWILAELNEQKFLKVKKLRNILNQALNQAYGKLTSPRWQNSFWYPCIEFLQKAVTEFENEYTTAVVPHDNATAPEKETSEQLYQKLVAIYHLLTQILCFLEQTSLKSESPFSQQARYTSHTYQALRKLAKELTKILEQCDDTHSCHMHKFHFFSRHDDTSAPPSEEVSNSKSHNKNTAVNEALWRYIKNNRHEVTAIETKHEEQRVQKQHWLVALLTYLIHPQVMSWTIKLMRPYTNETQEYNPYTENGSSAPLKQPEDSSPTVIMEL
jgi:hypothetical protein